MIKSFYLLTFLVLFAACARKGPAELTLDQVPAALRQAFATAKSSLLKTSAESTAKLVADKQYAAASLQLQALSANTDLTDEQRNIVAGATIAVNSALQELAASIQPPEAAPAVSGSPTPPAANNEDAAAAAAVLEHYKRTK